MPIELSPVDKIVADQAEAEGFEQVESFHFLYGVRFRKAAHVARVIIVNGEIFWETATLTDIDFNVRQHEPPKDVMVDRVIHKHLRRALDDIDARRAVDKGEIPKFAVIAECNYSGTVLYAGESNGLQDAMEDAIDYLADSGEDYAGDIETLKKHQRLQRKEWTLHIAPIVHVDGVRRCRIDSTE